MALLSALLSGLVTLSCGAAFLAVIYRTGLQRIDHDIRAIGENQSRQRLERFNPERFEQSIRFIFGTNTDNQIVLRIYDFAGNVFYESPQWPAQIDNAQIPLPEFTEEPAVNGRPPDFEMDPFERGRPPPNPGGPPELREAKFVTITSGREKWRFGVIGHAMVTAVIGINLKSLQAENDHYRNMFLMISPGALLLLGAAGWILARRALRPVAVIAEMAERINARDLHERIPDVRSDQEFARLIHVINEMLARLERSFNQAARFSADAAHELKTPLTVLQGQLEQALQESADDSTAQQVYAELLDEVQRLKNITRKLLLLSRADSGKLPLARETTDISKSVAEACDDITTQAPELKLQLKITPGIILSADPDLLNQIIHNLFSNAMKYNVKDGSIDVSLQANSTHAELKVSNTSEPLSGEIRERLFERFFRGDSAHHREVDGVGLGLSLSREIARAHGGDITLEASPPGWTTFLFKIPLK